MSMCHFKNPDWCISHEESRCILHTCYYALSFCQIFLNFSHFPKFLQKKFCILGKRILPEYIMIDKGYWESKMHFSRFKSFACVLEQKGWFTWKGSLKGSLGENSALNTSLGKMLGAKPIFSLLFFPHTRIFLKLRHINPITSLWVKLNIKVSLKNSIF